MSAKRRPRIAFAIAGGALVAAAMLLLAVHKGDAPVPTCEASTHDVATVWSPAIAADLSAKTSSAHAAVLEAAYRDWQAARAKACSAPPHVRQAQLQCLDGVLGRFDALRQAYARVPAAAAEDLQSEQIDPEICRKPAAADVPRLTLAPTRDVVAAYELYARSETNDKPSNAELVTLISKPNADPCARVIATLVFDASRDMPRARSLMIGLPGDLLDPEVRQRLQAHVLQLALQCEQIEADTTVVEIAVPRSAHHRCEDIPNARSIQIDEVLNLPGFPCRDDALFSCSTTDSSVARIDPVAARPELRCPGRGGA